MLLELLNFVLVIWIDLLCYVFITYLDLFRIVAFLAMKDVKANFDVFYFLNFAALSDELLKGSVFQQVLIKALDFFNCSLIKSQR